MTTPLGIHPRSIRARNLRAADNILGPEPSATCMHHTHIRTSHMQQCGGYAVAARSNLDGASHLNARYPITAKSDPCL